MGILDAPAPLLSWADGALAPWLPSGGRMALWGLTAALLSMSLYFLLSPQKRIAGLAGEIRRLQAKLRDDSLDMDEGLGHVKRLLRLAFARLGIVLGPVTLSILPVVCLAVWLDTYYAHELPAPGEPVEVRVTPSAGSARLIADGAPPRVDIVDEQGGVLQSVPLAVPVPVIEKRAAWNRLIGNPLGYLPDNGPVERVEIGLARRQLLTIGPDWMRGWEVPFFVSLLIGSLLIKSVFRIH